MAKFQWRYIRGFMVPQKIPTGYVLCHNHTMHTNDMHCGVNGFRAWFSLGKPPAGYVKCPCGWSGLPHYRLELFKFSSPMIPANSLPTKSAAYRRVASPVGG